MARPTFTLLTTLLACALALLAPGAAHGAPAHDLRGTWSCVSTAGGTCEFTIASMDMGSGTFSGTGAGNGYTWPVSGTLNGSALTMKHGPYDQLAYTANYTGEVSGDGKRMSGTYDDGRGPVPFDYPRVSQAPDQPKPPTPPPPTPEPAPQPNVPNQQGKRATRTQVMCTYVVATLSNTCTATVGDATGKASNPTGTVTFTSANGGVFSAGNRCMLQQRQGSVGVTSCTVEFIPPTDDRRVPDITGAYGGDAQFQPSSGTTKFLTAAPGTGVYLQTIKKFNPPTLKFDLKNPKKGSSSKTVASITDELDDEALCMAPGGAQASSAVVAIAAGGQGLRVKRVKRQPRVVSTTLVKRNLPAGTVPLTLRFSPRALRAAFPRSRRVQVIVRTRLTPRGGRPIEVFRRIKVRLRAGGPAGRGTRARAAQGPVARAAVVKTWRSSGPCGSFSVSSDDERGSNPPVAVAWSGARAVCFDQTVGEGANSGTYMAMPPFRGSTVGRVDQGFINFQMTGRDGPYSWGIGGSLGDGGGFVEGGLTYNGVSQSGAPQICQAPAPGALREDRPE